MTLRVCVTVCALLVAFSSLSAHSESRATVWAGDLHPTEAKAKVAEDFQKGNYRLYATLGVGWMLIDAGVDIDTASKRYEIVYVNGTSDHISSATAKRNFDAREFARIYNALSVKNCGAVK